jgi:hypothetical protein
MNLQDNQQYLPSAGDNVDVDNIGHIDTNLSRVRLILTLKNSLKNGRPPFHSVVTSLMKMIIHVHLLMEALFPK